MLLVEVTCTRAQVFKVDTLTYNGDIGKYINIVILGDGYTSTQQATFKADAGKLSAYLLTQVPWSSYADYFNVFAIEVISADSGAKHPNTAPDCSGTSVPVSSPNTYLGCTFDAYGIHRLVVPMNAANITNVLTTNFPTYDQVLIISNSPYYGGSGGSYATSTIHTSSKEVTAHEIGHSFTGLADEYYAGDGYAGERVNMTQQTNPSLIKWKAWIGTNSTGVYQHCCGGNSALWYKPSNHTCKMELLNSPFCSVCGEAIIESIHARVNPVVSYLPATAAVTSSQQKISFKLTKLMKPQPNTLNILWKLDGKIISKGTDSVIVDQGPLTAGVHTLTASVTDTTALLRVTNHATVHISTVTWTINKSATGVALMPSDNEFSCAIYPNPAAKLLNVSLELEKRSSVVIGLFSLDGRLVRQISAKSLNPGKQMNSIDVESLIPGVYMISVQVGEYMHTQRWIKE